MIEEQEQHSARYVQYAQGQTPHRRNSRYSQGQPNPQTPQGGPASGDKDAMAEIQEQITKAADGAFLLYLGLASEMNDIRWLRSGKEDSW
jgi:hypothetical protein